MKELSLEEVEELKNWPETAWPIRAYRWAQLVFPMRQPDWWTPELTFEQIKRRNGYEPQYRLFYHGTNTNIIGYNRLLAKYKKEFLAFLDKHKIQKTSYERFI